MTRKINIEKEKLINLYDKEELSTYKIGKIFNCNPSVIQDRLREFKIRLRQPKRKRNFGNGKLKYLYVRKKLSTKKIADILSISSSSVYYKLKEANIKTRKKRLFKISRNKLEELYIKRGLSCSKIAKLYGFGKVTIFKKLKDYSINTRKSSEANIKYPKRIFNGDDRLKAYMIGFRLGDLNVRSLNKNSTIKIKSSTTKEAHVNLIRRVYGSYGHFWIKKYGEVFSIAVFLDKSFNFLVKKEDNIEDWILKDNYIFFAFLAGYIDAEGNIGISQNRARLRIRSYDKNILFQIYNKLNSLNIKTKINKVSEKGIYSGVKHNKDCWGVFVNSKKDLLCLFKLIKPYMKHQKRINDLILAENNILERNKNQEKAIIV